jgi:threonyl-tRNA synthetase
LIVWPVSGKIRGMADENSRLEAMRHSCAHVMAQAVGEMFPDARFGIGPTIEDGFYYDFDLPRPLKPEDLPEIEKRMAAIVARGLPIVREEIDKERARELFAHQPYKLELIEELADQTLTIYRQEGFVDLCRGPHVENTGEIGPFKLLSIAGAYWRGDEKRPMLQRLYGTAFLHREELEAYLTKLEEAERRDHRRLGKELELFSIHEDMGPGLVHWHPKGATIRRIIEDFWKDEHVKRGYELIYTPHIARLDLWKISGHWELYREYLYSPMDIEGQEYILKPMNCPFHIKIYQSRRHSYRELPIRLAELGTVYRYERSGVLHGLARVRGFTQDDAHIFCRPDQMEAEVVGVLELARFMLSSFGFKEYELRLSTRPEKYAGNPEMWEEATATLRRALEKLSLPYGIDPGEGVFYGPKIDIKLKDALGRAWQGPTIQVDFNLPQRFEVNYDGEDGKPHPVVMVHRTVLGSMERFLACLTEHYRGAFPVWLAPIQAVLIPIADRHLAYAQKVEKALKRAGLRVRLDSRPERMQHKIREAQLEKVPYMLVMGDKEAQSGTVAVRLRDGQDKGPMSISQFKALARQAIKGRQ